MKRLILPIACGICTVTSDAQTDKQPHPNVIFIYADDLGYKDLSCTNKKPFLSRMTSLPGTVDG